MKIKTKLSLFIPLILIFITAFLVNKQVYANSDYGILSIEYNPSPLISGKNMTVTAIFYDTTNISSVDLLICTFTPDFLCESPIDMIETSQGIYEGIFLISYDAGTTVGFHIKINYVNDTPATIVPETPEFQDMAIVEPLTGFYYFDAGTVQVATDETIGCGIVGTILAISSISVVAKKKNSLKK